MGKATGSPWVYQTHRGLLMFNPIEQRLSADTGTSRIKGPIVMGIGTRAGNSFQLLDHESVAKLENGHRAWENHVAWALSPLSRQNRVTKIRTKRAPDGGRRGIHRAAL
jgi:hypothetical protein